MNKARVPIASLQADKARLQAEVDELRGLLYKTIPSHEPKAGQITAKAIKEATRADASHMGVTSAALDLPT